jgi:hypothetical protein
MAIIYNTSDPLSGIVSDGLIFYIHPALRQSYPKGGNVVYDLVDGQACTMNGTDIHVDGETFVFNGTDDWIDTNRVYIDDGTYSLSSANDDYTLEAWIYVETSSGTTTSADSIVGGQGNVGVGMQVGVSNGNPRINYAARSTSNFYSSEQSYNTWLHVVFAHQHGSFTRTFINGVLDVASSSTSYGINSGTYGNMTIGYSAPRVPNFFDGKMGPIRIYNKGLSDAEVLQNFNASKKRYGL